MMYVRLPLNTFRTVQKRFSSQFSKAPQDVLVQRVGPIEGILQLTLNRQAAKNAFSKNMLQGMQEAVLDAEQDKSLRAVILASSVPGVFCAGADLKERIKFTDSQVVEFVDLLRGLMSRVSELPVPVIAAIDGAALGGGLELALAADIRIASQTSKLGLPETRLAIIPGAGGTQRLTRLINPAVAKDLIYTGRVLTALEALTIGLVNYVVAPGAAVNRAVEIATEIAGNGPLAVRAAKRAICRGVDVPLEEGLRQEKDAYATVVPTRDRIEGLAAFQDKRRPVYEGR